jgi:hypothetical protein
VHRTLILAAAAALPLILAGPAHAQNRGGAWCAGQTIGGDSWYETCRFSSLRSCRREVLAGNRGVCFQNPYRSARSMRHHRRAYAGGRR